MELGNRKWVKRDVEDEEVRSNKRLREKKVMQGSHRKRMKRS